MFCDPQVGDYATNSTLTNGTVYPQAFPQAAMVSDRPSAIAVHKTVSPD
ncbi:hypothetical protein [Acaryochloris thomasi]|nr:hypothetical protein [Acaryochloris thomasi]